MTFQELGLIPPILAALREQGYTAPSPIQEKAIPPALQGRDLLGCAQTGTGKTCAFSAPILQRLSAAPEKKHPLRALILTPTRELAIQIQENLAAYGKHLPLRSAVIFGGVGQNPQVEALKRGVDVLVATPGRLMDLYQQKLLDLSKIQILVLDEADRMLDMGFIHDVKKILKWLPPKKQTMLFSATMPPEIAELVDSLLKQPARVAVNPVSSPVEAIRQSIYFVDKANKTKLLAHLVQERQVKNALVFTRTKHGANKVARDLEKMGITAAAIHGNKSQTARQQALAGFKAGKLRCLVATDIAARGLDIEELSHVFNYNLPEVPETYVHRIGRTGRAGRGGEAIAFCDFSEKPLLKDIEKLTGKRIHLVERHPFPMQVFTAPAKNQEDQEARQAAKEAKARQVRPKAPQGKEPGEKAVKLQEAKPVKRGVRPGKKLDTGDAMPRTDFQRPNPLDSDVIMDATARLLAPRRVSLTPAAPAAKKTQSKPNLQSKAPVKAPSKPKARPQAKAAQHRPKPQAQMPRRGRAPEPQRPRAKDSTEQPSLMKPFYINMGD
ncbi:MAG: DEAD/DEAH box helicase [Oscillospiraceae bacterium]|nr:DEAD/DEAH box helicase [Oscillospiraceae bacterium]MCI9581811.1 DEAD/DEAH box helicase [Oscillospiraceae bacterium]